MVDLNLDRNLKAIPRALGCLALPTAKIDAKLAPGELRECLNSEVTPPIPVFNGDLSPPTWWQPPAVKFRVTQQIKWYAGYDSGYGNALYSAYDEPSRILWIYDFGGQHRCFWKKGQFPPGTSFTQDSAPLLTPKPVAPKP